MARRKSRSVESDPHEMLVTVWLIGTALCWVAMAVVLFLPSNMLWERGPIYATAIGATGVIMTAARRADAILDVRTRLGEPQGTHELAASLGT